MIGAISAGALVLLELGAVLVMALAAVALLRRRMGLGVGSNTRATVRLGQGHALHRVEIAGRTLLVGTGPDGPPTLLMEIEPTAPVARPRDAGAHGG